MSDLQGILNALNEVAIKNAIQIYVPSLKRVVNFKPITGAQQQKLYNCGFDNIVFRTKFIITTYDIIVENCLEPDITKSFNIIDRLAILIAYKAATYGNISEHEHGKIDLLPIIEKMTNVQNSTEIIEFDNIKVQVGISSMLNQYTHEKVLREKAVIEKTDEKTFVDAFGELYNGELCKTIQELYIDGITVNFNALNVPEQLTIVGGLPVNIINKIGLYLKDLVTMQTALLTTTVLTEETQETVVLDVSADFLTNVY